MLGKRFRGRRLRKKNEWYESRLYNEKTNYEAQGSIVATNTGEPDPLDYCHIYLRLSWFKAEIQGEEETLFTDTTIVIYLEKNS